MKSALLAATLAAMFTSPAAPQDAPKREIRSWTTEERAQLFRFYTPIASLTNSSHWHHWDCCQSNRCFPARPGSVVWTVTGIAITHPDGNAFLYSEHDEIWKPKQYAGLDDPRYHVCWEKDADGEWFPICAYRGWALS